MGTCPASVHQVRTPTRSDHPGRPSTLKLQVTLSSGWALPPFPAIPDSGPPARMLQTVQVPGADPGLKAILPGNRLPAEEWAPRDRLQPYNERMLPPPDQAFPQPVPPNPVSLSLSLWTPSASCLPLYRPASTLTLLPSLTSAPKLTHKEISDSPWHTVAAQYIFFT